MFKMNEEKLTVGLIVFFTLLSILAIVKERSEQKNAYIQGIPQDSDTDSITFRRIVECLTTDEKTIKWRRSLLYSLIITILLYSVVLYRFPRPRELVLTILIVYLVYYFGWRQHVSATLVKAGNIGKENLKRLRTRRVRFPTIFKFPTI